MLRDFNLHTVISLPPGTFAPYSDVKTALLFFERPGPTQETWYYELPLPAGLKKFSKSSPIQDEHFAEAQLLFEPAFQEGLKDLQIGKDILVLAWLDRGDCATLSVHARDDARAPLRGVFSTRSQDRPNPVGLHRVTILDRISPIQFRVQGL